MTPRIWIYAAIIAGCLAIGALWQRDHAALVEAKARDKAHSDSLHIALARANAAEHLFDSTKAAYYALPPAVVQVVKWRTKVNTIVDSLTVRGDSTDATLVTALFDSVTSDCARRDSLARDALEAATAALGAKDSALAIATHPPKPPPQPAVGFFASGAYDMIQKGVALQAGVEIKKWKSVKPFAAVGALVAQQAQGSLQVGVRVEF